MLSPGPHCADPKTTTRYDRNRENRHYHSGKNGQVEHASGHDDEQGHTHKADAFTCSRSKDTKKGQTYQNPRETSHKQDAEDQRQEAEQRHLRDGSTRHKVDRHGV